MKKMIFLILLAAITQVQAMDFSTINITMVENIVQTQFKAIDSIIAKMPLPSHTAQITAEQVKATFNNTLDNWRAHVYVQDIQEARASFCGTYSWAIPCREALVAIANLKQPLIELGAGLGLWAKLLQDNGVDMVAYDINPIACSANKYFTASQTYCHVDQGDETVLKQHPERTLFLCWPDENSDFAYNALRHCQGNYLVYIGEARNGCTADSKFFDLIENDFDLHQTVEIPCWKRPSFLPQLSDKLWIYKRKNHLKPDAMRAVVQQSLKQRQAPMIKADDWD